IRAEVIPWHHEESLWDVVDLIVQGQRAEAIRRVMQMLNDGAAPLMLLVVFARRLTEIERARQWQKAGRSAPEWEQQAGYKGFHAKRLWQAAQKWDARRLELLTDWAFRIDRAMKTGYGDAADWLIFWLGLLPETQNKSPRRVRGA
ncbi:MAG: DNA polymerase III subunit delta, partial [Sulfobacillus sp.]|nr:DNA polymerase III subunit delta [Sulfobacillus sp.]